MPVISDTTSKPLRRFEGGVGGSLSNSTLFLR